MHSTRRLLRHELQHVRGVHLTLRTSTSFGSAASKPQHSSVTGAAASAGPALPPPALPAPAPPLLPRFRRPCPYFRSRRSVWEGSCPVCLERCSRRRLESMCADPCPDTGKAEDVLLAARLPPLCPAVMEASSLSSSMLGLVLVGSGFPRGPRSSMLSTDGPGSGRADGPHHDDNVDC